MRLNAVVIAAVPSWHRRLSNRLNTDRTFKLIGLTVFMTAFFTSYFLLLNLPLFPITVMPMTAIDRLVGFHPLALVLYVSLWPYVCVAPLLLDRRQDMIDYFVVATGLSLVGMACFLFWPTAAPPPEVDWSQYRSFAFLKSVDAAGNACPSLHVAFAVFTAVWFDPMLKRLGDRGGFRVASLLLCLGIVWSTMATKQHVAIDVLAGALLGLAAGTLLRRRQARIQLISA